MNPVATAGAQMAAANLDEVRREYRYWQMRILATKRAAAAAAWPQPPPDGRRA